MIWQDIVFSLGSVIFTIALMPSILGKDKPALLTSIITGFILMLFTITYFSLGLVFSAFSVGSTGIAWLILAFQRFNIEKQRKK